MAAPGTIRIAVVVGSSRPGRRADQVAEWLMGIARHRDTPGVEYRLVDLADDPLPLFDEELPPMAGSYTNEHTRRWANTVDRFDGFVFVTPEYNHSFPAVLKNAIDYLYAEWNDKAAAFVSYGSLGGARAIEHLRGISAELQMADVRQQLSFSLFSDFENFSTFRPGPQHDDAAVVLFDQIEAWAGALKPLRVAEKAAA
jgi:NAD(P)H-dependent FMN reductase